MCYSFHLFPPDNCNTNNMNNDPNKKHRNVGKYQANVLMHTFVIHHYQPKTWYFSILRCYFLDYRSYFTSELFSFFGLL